MSCTSTQVALKTLQLTAWGCCRIEHWRDGIGPARHNQQGVLTAVHTCCFCWRATQGPLNYPATLLLIQVAKLDAHANKLCCQIIALSRQRPPQRTAVSLHIETMWCSVTSDRHNPRQYADRQPNCMQHRRTNIPHLQNRSALPLRSICCHFTWLVSLTEGSRNVEYLSPSDPTSSVRAL